jgi:hypothetical protein
MASKQSWTTVSLNPLIGGLDTLSRPADVPVGWFRWKLNFRTSAEGKLCRRYGFQKFYSDAASFTNHDHHQQGATREPITGMFESTENDGTRRFFDWTQSRVSLLDPDTGLYTDIISGMGDAGSRWKAAELQNVVVFTNDVDEPRFYDVATEDPPVTIADLPSKKAKVVIQFNGYIILMNTFEEGERMSARVRWCDLNLPKEWREAPGLADSLAGFQDLQYGDEILAAAPMLGALYIYTRRSIWKMFVAGTDEGVFGFTKVYSEPKNQTGCLAFPDTLVTTGGEHYYMGRDGIYKFSPYIPTPQREDWLHRASGVIYTKADTKIDPDYCASPVAEYIPDAREIWFSWPSAGQSGVNNWTLVAQIEHKTADIVDAGFTALCNFRRTPESASRCNETQEFVGASGLDYCLKSIGGVFLREYAVLTNSLDPTEDLPAEAAYSSVGYDSVLRSLIPLGFTDRDKLIRNVLVDHDTTSQEDPCVFRLRIGNSYSLVDANSEADTCAPLWRQMPDRELACSDPSSIAAMRANNLRPAIGTEWRVYERGRFLYFELSITNADHTAAIGGDTCLQRIDFDAMALAKE